MTAANDNPTSAPLWALLMACKMRYLADPSPELLREHDRAWRAWRRAFLAEAA